MAFDPKAFLAGTPAPAPSYSLPYDESDFKIKRGRAAAYDPYIDLFAKDHPDVPEIADLTRAVLMRESGGRPNAVSPAGAVGLMQMLPATYAEQGGTGDPMNALENIEKGMGYLADQYRKFGSAELALAAYNAGPGSVRKHGGIPPYKETQEYVPAVMGYLGALRSGAPSGTTMEFPSPAPGASAFDPKAFLGEPMKPTGPAPAKPAPIPGVPGLGGEKIAGMKPQEGPVLPWLLPENAAALEAQKTATAAHEVLGERYLEEKKKHPLSILTPERMAAREGGKEDKRSFLGQTLGDVLGTARNVTTVATAKLQGKSIAEKQGERYAAAAYNLEREPIFKEAKRKLDAGEPLTPDEEEEMKAHPGFLKSLGEFAKAAAKDPLKTAADFGISMIEDLPVMLLGQVGVAGTLGALAKLRQGWQASRSLAYAEKLAERAAEARLAKPGAAAVIGKDVAENALAGPVSLYPEAKARGEQYGPTEAARDMTMGAGFAFAGAPTKLLRSAKDPRPTVGELRKHPAIAEMMPRFQALMQNPETSGIKWLIQPKHEGEVFLSREQLAKMGYGEQEAGYFEMSGEAHPDGTVVLRKTAGPDTQIEEAAHFLQNRVRENSAKNTESLDPQLQFYTDLQEKISEWQTAIEAEAKAKKLDIPKGDELLGQVLAAHLGYADSYPPSVQRIVLPDAILEGFQKLLGDDPALKGTVFPDGDLAAASDVFDPRAFAGVDEEVKAYARNKKAGTQPDETIRVRADDLPPRRPAPGTPDSPSNFPPPIVESDAVRRAMYQEGRPRLEAEPAAAAPAEPPGIVGDLPPRRPAPGTAEPAPKFPPGPGRRPLEVEPAAAPAPSPTPEVPGDPEIPPRRPAPGTPDVPSNFPPPAREPADFARVMNQAGRRPLVEESAPEAHPEPKFVQDVRAALATKYNRTADDPLLRDLVQDPATGLLSKHVFEQDMKDRKLGKGHATVDIDNLPAVSKRFGEAGGDKIQAVAARILAEEVEKIGGRAYRNGEGMQIRAKDQALAKLAAAAAKERLRAHTVEFFDKNGKSVGSIPGIRLDYGYDVSPSAADARLHAFRARAETLPPEHPDYRAPSRMDRGVPGSPAAEGGGADGDSPTLHVGRHVADALTRGKAIHLHPDDALKLKLYKGQALNPDPMSPKEMWEAVGMPVRIDPGATRLSKIAHDLNEGLAERQGEPVHILGHDGPDPDYGFHEDDLAQALLNRPRTKEAYQQELAAYRKKLRQDHEQALRDQHGPEMSDKGFPADWDAPPVAKTGDADEGILFQLRKRPASAAGIPKGKESDPKALAAAAKAWKEKGTESPFFKRWFGESKVVDPEEKPQVVYHGTSKKFSKFSFKNAAQKIIWFTSNKADIEAGEVGAQGHGHIMDLYASIKNPAGWAEYKKFGLGELHARGFDGAILPDRDGSYTGFVFDGEQLKSASKNRGTFDPADPDIRYQLRPARKPAEPGETPEVPKPRGQVIPFPKKERPAAGAAVPPEILDEPRQAGPRVEERDAALRQAELKTGKPPVQLDRETKRTWESLDEDVRQLLMTHGMEHFEHAMKHRQLSDVEVMAFDSIVRQKAEAMEAAQAELAQATTRSRPAAEAQALAAAGEYAAAQVMQLNGLTETARALAAASRRMRAASPTDTPALVRALAKSLPDVGPKDLATLIHAWKTAPEQFPELLRQYANPGKMKKMGEFYRAGLLSWVPTHVRNIAGNTGETLARLAETPLAGALDAVAQLIHGGDRARYAGEAGAEVVGLARAFPGALQGLGRGLKSLYHDEPINPLEPLERQLGAIGKGSPGPLRTVEKAIGKAYTRPIFKLLSIEDRFFRDVGGTADLHRLALRQALSEGKTGKAAAARTGTIMAETAEGKHPAILREVARLNDERVFQEDPGQFVRTLSHWANKSPLAFFLPFVRTPANLAKRTLQRTPLGFLKAGAEYKAWRKAVEDKAPAEEIAKHRGEAMDAGARALAGTTLLSGFAALASTGIIGMTGGGPKEKKEKNLLRESGWQPYSFFFEAGGEKHWVPYAWWEPVSSLLSMAADLAESKTEEGYDYGNAAQRIAYSLTSKTYLTSLIDLAEFVNGVTQGEAGAAGSYASKFAGGWVPQFIGRAAQGLDPVLRDTKPTQKGLAGVGERVAKTVKAKIPGLSETVPPIFSTTGEPVKRGGTSLSRWLAPAQTSGETDATPLVAGLSDAGFVPPDVPREVTIKGPGGRSMKTQLSDDERARVAEAQAAVSRKLAQRMRAPSWGAMQPERQEKLVRDAYQDARDREITRIRAQRRREGK